MRPPSGDTTASSASKPVELGTYLVETHGHSHNAPPPTGRREYTEPMHSASIAPRLAPILADLARAGRPVPTVLTARMRLRPLEMADLPDFVELHADPLVMATLGGPLDRPAAEALCHHVCAGARQRGFGLWALQRLSDGRFLGMAGLWSPDWTATFTPAVELAWRLVHHAWGQGYATEAATAALHWAFIELQLPQVQAWTAVGNARSLAVIARLEMQPAGEFVHPKLLEGHPLRRHARFTRDAPPPIPPPSNPPQAR